MADLFRRVAGEGGSRLPIPTHDPDEVRRTADDVLSRSAYQPQSETIVDRVFEWIGEQIGNLIGAVTGTGPGQFIGLVFFGVLIAAVIFVLNRAGRIGAVSLVVDRPSVTSATTERITAAQWRKEAARLTAAGDLRGALRCHYQATTESLIDSAVVDPTVGLTGRQHLLMVAQRSPEVREEFTEILDRFERVWFGGDAVTADQLETFMAISRRVASARAEVLA